MESHRSPNITNYHQCSWLPSRNWQWDPIAEDTTNLNHRALKNQVGIDPEVSALLKRAIHQNILTQIWILRVTVMTCQAWHAHGPITSQMLGSNQPFSDWIQVLLHEMEPILGTVNVVKRPRSQTLGENSHSAKWLTVTKQLLMTLTHIHTNQCISQASETTSWGDGNSTETLK